MSRSPARGEYDDRSFRVADDETGHCPARHPPPLVDHFYGGGGQSRSRSRWEQPVTRPERDIDLTHDRDGFSMRFRTRDDKCARTSALTGGDTNASPRRRLEPSFAESRARRARGDVAEDGSASVVLGVGSYSASQQASRDTVASQADDDWVEIDPKRNHDRGPNPIRETEDPTSYPGSARFAVSASASASVPAAAGASGTIHRSASSSASNGTWTKSRTGTSSSSITHSASPPPPRTSPDLDALTSLEEAKREMEMLRNDRNADIDELVAACVRYRKAKQRAGVDESMSTSQDLLSSDERRRMEHSGLILPIPSFSQPIQSSRSYHPCQSSSTNSPNPPSQPRPGHSQGGRTSLRTSLSPARSTSASQRRSSGGAGSWETRKSPLRQVMSADNEDDDDSDADDHSSRDLGLSDARSHEAHHGVSQRGGRS